MIDLTKMDIPKEDCTEFMSLCDDMYSFIATSEDANMFILSSEFPEEENKYFDTALDVLFKEGLVRNSSKGYEIGGPAPEYSGFEEVSNVVSDTGETIEQPIPDDEGVDPEYSRLAEIESSLNAIMESEEYYNPSRELEDYISSMGRSTTKTILEKAFIELCDLNDLLSDYKEANETLAKFCKSYPLNETDMEIFNNYNLPYNVYIYLFNRTEGYYRLLQMKMNMESGYGDIATTLFDSTSRGFFVNLNPSSDEKVDLRLRLDQVMRTYFKKNGTTPQAFTESLLGIMSNTPHSIEELKYYCKQYLGLPPSQYSSYLDSLDGLFSKYIVSNGYVKHLTTSNISSIIEILNKEERLNYGATVEMIYKNRQKEYYELYLDTPDELRDFILEYTDFRIEDGHVLKSGTLEDAIKSFIIAKKSPEPVRIKRMYARNCGLDNRVKEIIDGIDAKQLVNDKALTESEISDISKRLKEYEWISEANAKSVFSDIFGLADKFSEANMHSVGFSCLQDVYYRTKYGSFNRCFLQTEFVGDDVYVDERKFKINMECRAFAFEVESLQRYAHWIPVSSCRYINLRSERYKGFASIYIRYRNFVRNLCEKKFVTPFLLKNMKCGIPEIDDDDYEISFYSSVLLSANVRHQTFSGQRFYYQPTDSSPYICTAPEFVRYIVYESGGKVSISELQMIIESEYGIHSEVSFVRNQVKISRCKYSVETDYAYIDNDMYMEALNYE